MNRVRLVKSLPYTYTEEERLQQSLLGAERRRERIQLAAEFELVKKDFKRQIEALEKEESQYSENVRCGYEYRDIACEALLDVPRRGQKTVVRLDTGEVVAEESVTDDERQMCLDLQRQAEAAARAEAREFLIAWERPGKVRLVRHPPLPAAVAAVRLIVREPGRNFGVALTMPLTVFGAPINSPKLRGEALQFAIEPLDAAGAPLAQEVNLRWVRVECGKSLAVPDSAAFGCLGPGDAPAAAGGEGA